MRFRAHVREERWCGHGEGVTVVKVSIEVLPPLTLSNPYHSTDDDCQAAIDYCEQINQCLADAGLLAGPY